MVFNSFFVKLVKNRYKSPRKGKNICTSKIYQLWRKENIMTNSQNKNSKKLPGFYIALCCCVLAIGFGGYISEKSKVKHEEPEEIVLSELSQQDEVLQPVNETIVIEDTTSTPAPDSDTSAPSDARPVAEPQVQDYTFDNPDTQATAVIVNAEEPYFHMPVGGEILEGFSTELIYNKAMGDWRTHNGIDIAADVGCSVSACADGIIEEVFTDAYGCGISIKHNNGFTTKYMCLGATESLKAGDEIKGGEVIGTIGEQKGENVTEPHLHLEMYDGDTILNPQQYLK